MKPGNLIFNQGANSCVPDGSIDKRSFFKAKPLFIERGFIFL